MQIMIDIPEEEYKRVMDGKWTGNDLVDYIEKGIPLSKGHDRLIDANELRQDIIAHKYSNSFCEEHHIDQSINVGMLNILIADAPTIIEADNSESEYKK